MRHWALFLLIFIGCSSSVERPQYNPVEWDSQVIEKPEIIPNPQPEQLSEKAPNTLEILLKLHNDQRGLKGRTPLELDPYLCQYAQKHSDWMANKNKMRHSSISSLLDKYSKVGENVAWNQKTEAQVVDAWMNSSGHRANILSRSFTKVGFGLSRNSAGQPYWCTCFGL